MHFNTMAFRHTGIWLALILVSLNSTAFERYSPMDDWQSTESAHYRITYLPEHQPVALQAAVLSEQLLSELERFFDWQPEHKIDILISPSADTPNGYATPFPYNRIVLFPAQPGLHGELSDYHNWMEDLLRHELVHIIHLDKARQLPLTLRSVFGRYLFLFPNLFQPNFYKEGLATFIETSWDKGTGRGQSAYYDMILRSEVDKGLLPLSKVQQQNKDWPLNQSYSYGVAFYQFLEQLPRENVTKGLINSASSQLIPLRLNSPLAANTPYTSIEQAWQHFEEWLEFRYQQQIDDLRLAIEPARQRALTDSGYFNGAPYVDAEGFIFYSAFDPYRPQQLRQISPDGRVKDLLRLHGKTEIVGKNGNHLWFLQESACDHHQSSFDLYRLDLDTLKTTRTTHCQHYIQGSLNPISGQPPTMLALKEVNGSKHIVSVDLQTMNETTLLAGKLNENFASPRWLVPNETLVYAYKPPQQAWQIARLDRAKAEQSIVLQDDQAGFFAVEVSPDGQYLYLESDKNQVVEIWRSTTDGQQLKQMTRSMGGATRPSIDPVKQRLVYRGYDHSGWNIYEAPLTPVDEAQISRIVAPVPGFEQANIHAASAHSETPVSSRPYRAWDTVWPTSWFFNFSSDRAHTTANILLSGQDTLGFHQWSLQAGRDFENDLPVGQLSYTLYHHFNISYERYYEYQIGDASVPATFVDKAITEELHENYSASAFYDQMLEGATLSWFAGANVNEETYLNLVNQSLFRDWQVHTFGAGVHFYSASRPWLSLGPVAGRSVKATLEKDRVRTLASVNGERRTLSSSGAVWSLDWTEYLQVYQAQRLALRLFTAHAERGADLFDLGGSSLRSLFTDRLIHHRDYRLRAYPDGTPELIGRKPKLLSADYAFPLLRVNQGIAGWPLGMRDLSGTLFYESGQADKRFERFDGAGFELELGLDLAYSLLPLTVTGGVALPFQDTLANRQKDANFYVNLGLGL